jgi:hypothetical protein
MKRVVAVVVAITASSTAFAAYGTGSFALSDKGSQATVTMITGVNSSNARMEGHITRADAEEACERDAGGGVSSGAVTLDSCIRAEMAFKGGIVRAAADCDLGIIVTPEGQKFYFKGIADHFGTSAKWIDIKTEKPLEALNFPPSVGRIATAQFKTLCPQKVAQSMGPQPKINPKQPWVGKYNSVSKAECRKGNRSEGHMAVGPKTYYYAETDCNFRSVRTIKDKHGIDNYIAAAICDAEGEEISMTIKLIPNGPDIIKEVDGEQSYFYRCN